MKNFQSLTFVATMVFSTSVFGLEPLMVSPAEVVWQSDFAEEGMVLEKTEWTPRQGTRWEVIDGVLRGIDSSDTYQAERPHHRGYEPRISAPITPKEFTMAFRIRFVGGEETAVVPFIEFGHHIVRLRFTEAEGAMLLTDGETMKVAEDPDFVWEDGEWYRCLAELKGDEFVIQIEDGPTFYAKDEVLAKAAPSGGVGFGTAGPKAGMVEIDDVTFWSVGDVLLDSWEARRSEFPVFEPVQVREKREPKK